MLSFPEGPEGLGAHQLEGGRQVRLHEVSHQGVGAALALALAVSRLRLRRQVKNDVLGVVLSLEGGHDGWEALHAEPALDLLARRLELGEPGGVLPLPRRPKEALVLLPDLAEEQKRGVDPILGLGRRERVHRVVVRELDHRVLAELLEELQDLVLLPRPLVLKVPPLRERDDARKAAHAVPVARDLLVVKVVRIEFDDLETVLLL
mmetsp:Transcript_2062/g.6883  ORF Transcript_2062/g.6883 Transcript_2062/m.6883 type:complete len:206 (-) Transcript_2062:456-1073(-)